MKSKKKLKAKLCAEGTASFGPTDAQLRTRLTDMVAAAHALGIQVSFSLKPQLFDVPCTVCGVPTAFPGAATHPYVCLTCQRPPVLNIPSSQWPGNPTTRHVIAALNCTRRDIERGFKNNPSAKWIITPYAIIGREEFFTPVVTTTSTGTNATEKQK